MGDRQHAGRSALGVGCVMSEQIKELIGKTLINVSVRKGEYLDDEVVFHVSDDEIYKLYHERDCCESVNIEDIIGDIDDLIGSPILKAELNTSNDNGKPEDYEDFTWSFYTLSTIKGTVDIRWPGS